MKKNIIAYLLFMIVVLLSACSDEEYLERSLKTYYYTKEEAAISDKISTNYKFQNGEDSDSLRLKMDIGEKIELERVSTSAGKKYSIAYIEEDGSLWWHSFHNSFEKVTVYVEDIEKPYVVRKENKVYYKDDLEVYYPRHAVYEIHLKSEELTGIPNVKESCEGTKGKLNYKCEVIVEENEFIN